jgi:dynein heavy chain
LKEAAAATQIKMQEVSVQKSAADQLKEVIVGEEQVVQDAVNEANKIKEDCENDLREAMPDLIAAEDALKVLDKKQIEFLKTMKNPS